MPGAPVAQSTQLSASVKSLKKPDEPKAGGGANDGGSFDDSNDDLFIMSTQSTVTGKSPCKRPADREVSSGSKLAKLIEEGGNGGSEKGSLEGVEFEPEELASGFLAEPREEAEVELEVNSNDLFKGWNDLEVELDEPHSGEELKANRMNFSEKELYGDDDAAKGDMYQGIQVEGDEDTDDEELYYSQDKVGSVHEVEEDVEYEQTMAQPSLPPGQSQMIHIEGGPRTQAVTAENNDQAADDGESPQSQAANQPLNTANSNTGNQDAEILVENQGPNFPPDNDVLVNEAPGQPDDVLHGPANRNPDNANVGNENLGDAGHDDVGDDVEDPRQNLYHLRGKSTTYAKNQMLTKKL